MIQISSGNGQKCSVPITTAAALDRNPLDQPSCIQASRILVAVMGMEYDIMLLNAHGLLRAQVSMQS